MRFSRPQALVVGVLTAGALALAGCGGNSDAQTSSTSPTATAPTATPSQPSASPSPSKAKVPVSTNLDAIRVTGNYGKAPKVTVKSPWAVDKTRAKVLDPGEGGTVKAGQSVTVNYYGVNGRTGKKFDDSFSRGAPVTFPLDQVVPGFQKGLLGQRQGSRVVIAMPGSDGYDASGGSPQAGIQVGDTLVFVVDVVAVPLDGPRGKAVQPKAGLPTVTDRGGVPSVTMPKTDPPKNLRVQPLIEGSGPEVQAGDTVTINYRWYTWKGRLVEDSYASKQPATVALHTLIQGLQKGLAGQPVGSRVLLVIPPSLSYPNGNATPAVDKTDTQVMVVDVLFTQPQQ